MSQETEVTYRVMGEGEHYSRIVVRCNLCTWSTSFSHHAARNAVVCGVLVGMATSVAEHTAEHRNRNLTADRCHCHHVWPAAAEPGGLHNCEQDPSHDGPHVCWFCAATLEQDKPE